MDFKTMSISKFSTKSAAKLATCHVDLQTLMNEAIINGPDFSVLCGYRSPSEQNELYRQGRTEPGNIVTNVDGFATKSNHNYKPSKAVDIVPYPVDWENLSKFLILAGYILATADSLKINIRWGGDWNKNYNLTNDKFIDMPHFELVGY